MGEAEGVRELRVYWAHDHLRDGTWVFSPNVPHIGTGWLDKDQTKADGSDTNS